MHPATLLSLTTRVNAEDQKPFIATLVQRHEHVGAAFLLHTAKLTATISCHPTFAIFWHVHLCDIIAILHINCDAPFPLSQEPSDEVSDAATFLQRSRHEGNGADVLQNAT